MPKLKKTTVTPATPVIEYGKPNQTWTVLEGVAITSATAPTVLSEDSHSTLVNHGSIFSNTDFGVYFDSLTNLIIKNKESGHIAAFSGVFIGRDAGQSDNSSVYNDGTISSAASSALRVSNSSNFYLKNTGEMVGFLVGIALSQTLPSLDKKTKIVNNGDIIGQTRVGIESELTDVRTVVENKNGAKIEGSLAAIVSTNRLKVSNDGKIKGHIFAGGPDTKDKVVNSGKVTGDVDLLGGNDTYKSKNGRVDGMIRPGDGNDKIICGSQKEKIDLNTMPDETSNVDDIKHFESGKDMLFLFHVVFSSFTGPGPLDPSEFHEGKTAQDGDDYLLYHKKSGQLWYDADGNLAGDKIKIADFDDGTKLKASDIEIYA